jgi:hypothetical protein
MQMSSDQHKANATIIRTVLVAYNERTHMSTIYEPLSDEGQVELYLFNAIFGWFYLSVTSKIPLQEENLKKYVAVAGGQFQGAQAEYYRASFTSLFFDRFTNYKKELQLVKTSQLTGNEYLPAYFFIRLYKYPLGKEPIGEYETVRRFSGESNSIMILLFKNHVNHLRTLLDIEIV